MTDFRVNLERYINSHNLRVFKKLPEACRDRKSLKMGCLEPFLR